MFKYLFLLLVFFSNLFPINNKDVEELIALDQFEKAENKISSLEEFEKYYFTAIIKHFRNKNEEAYFILLKALEIKPNDPDILYWTANVLNQTDNSKDENIPSGKTRVNKVFDLLNKAYEINPKHEGVIFNLALQYKILPWFYGGDDDKVDEIINNTSKFNKQYADRCRLQLLLLENELDEVEKFGKQCIKNYPESSVFYGLTANGFFRQKKSNMGFETLELGLANVKAPRLLSYYGLYSLKMKIEYKKAITYLESYLNLSTKINILKYKYDRRLHSASYILGKLYYLTEDFANAKKYLELSLIHEPTYKKSKRLLEKMNK